MSEFEEKYMYLLERNIASIPKGLIKRFAEKGYIESTVRKQIKRVDHLERSLILKHFKPKRKDTIAFSLTYNPVLPNIKQIISKH